MNMKIVINADYGGFGLSHEGTVRYAKLAGIDLTIVDRIDSATHYDYYIGNIKDKQYFWDGNIARNDPALVQTVEELGSKAGSKYSCLKVVEIPDEVNWYIEEYDGNEWVAEQHRTWR